MRKNTIDRPFGARDKVGYMFGDFGCNMSFQLIGTFLMLFVTQGLHIDVTDWAIIVIIAKIFDAINDPIIGALVDAKKPGKHGRYKPWIFWGAIAIAITTTLLFINVDSFSYWGKFTYVLVMYCVWSIAYTVANVPYGSLNAALTDDPGQRASLSSLRSIGAGFAMLPVLIVIPGIVYTDKNVIAGNEGLFVWIALACGLIGIIGFLLTIFLTKERNIIPNLTREKFNYKQTIKTFVKSPALVSLCLASFAQLVFIMSYSTTVPLVCQFYFMDAGLIKIANIAIMIPMMVFIPFISKLCNKHGTKSISTWPNIASIIALILMLCVPFPRTSTGAWIYLGMYMIAMIGGGTFMLTTWSMVADCVDDQELKNGVRNEASIYATYSFTRKVAQGIGASLVGFVLSMVGYSTISNQAIENNKEVGIATGILNISIILPLVGYILVFIVLLLFYNLNKKQVNLNTNLLKVKHSEVVVTKTSLFYEDGVKEEVILLPSEKELEAKRAKIKFENQASKDFRNIFKEELNKIIK